MDHFIGGNLSTISLGLKHLEIHFVRKSLTVFLFLTHWSLSIQVEMRTPAKDMALPRP